MPEIRPVALPQVQTGIPATLSYELLARRPDLQAMRWYVQASLDQVDSARALFYPSFDIKAFFGLDSIHLHTLFKKTSRQFNFIPGLKLPLFDGGRLNANLEGTRAASNMMIERYNQSVLNAVRDVAVNGTRLQTLNDEREMQAERVEATRFTQRAAEAAYQRGLTSRLQATEARLPVLVITDAGQPPGDPKHSVDEIAGRRVSGRSRRREKIKCLPRDGCHAVFRFVTSKLTTACFSSEF